MELTMKTIIKGEEVHTKVFLGLIEQNLALGLRMGIEGSESPSMHLYFPVIMFLLQACLNSNSSG